MAVRAGKMRHRFTLFKPLLGSDGTPVRNDFGQETGELEVVQRPWCNVLQVQTTEHVSTAIQGQETIQFEVRWSKIYENTDTNMTLRFEDNDYDIVSATDPTKIREKLIVTAILRR